MQYTLCTLHIAYDSHFMCIIHYIHDTLRTLHMTYITHSCDTYYMHYTLYTLCITLHIKLITHFIRYALRAFRNTYMMHYVHYTWHTLHITYGTHYVHYTWHGLHISYITHHVPLRLLIWRLPPSDEDEWYFWPHIRLQGSWKSKKIRECSLAARAKAGVLRCITTGTHSKNVTYTGTGANSMLLRN